MMSSLSGYFNPVIIRKLSVMLNLVFIAGPGWPENQIENHATTIQLHIRAFRYQIERVFVFYYSIFFSKRH